ncbi:DUF5671 domain-containing protein [Georgenia muralis]
MGVALSLIPLLITIGIVYLVVNASRRHGGPGAPDARGVRRFFQYALLGALVLVTATGVSDLLGHLLDDRDPDDRAALARALAFTVVGGPLAAALAWWTRRRHLRDPGETASTTYGLYLPLTALTALAVAMVQTQAAVTVALQARPGSAGAAVAVLVWGGLWLVHWWLAERTLSPDRNTGHLLLGSAAGLGTALAGFVLLLSAALDLLVRAEPVLGGTAGLGTAAATFLVGAVVWVQYWVLNAARGPRGVPWLLLVLPVGVGGGLVVAVVGASVLLWDVLVWFLGDVRAPSALEHFAGAPTAVGAVVGGAVVWWYHRAVLAETRVTRTEVRRIYEYLVAGIGLVAAATGVGMVLVAAVESLTPGVDVGVTVRNTLLGAVTLLVVGVPLWWGFWRGIGRAVVASPRTEVASRTRRTYLVLLFGIAGVAAVVALIVAAYLLLEDLLAGELSGATARDMRYALGVLVAAAAVSAYHGSVFRQDRELVPPTPELPAGPRSVVLVGPADDHLARELARRTGARVELWPRLDDDAAAAWSLTDLVTAVEGYPGADVLVLGGSHAPEVVPVGRHR